MAGPRLGLTRRRALATLGAGLALAATRRAFGGAPLGGPAREQELLDWRLPFGARGTRRVVVLAPRGAAPAEGFPLLVLLHGLGESGDERMGAYAWVERYGLGSAYERLSHPPIARTSKRPDLADARVVELNAALAERPFAGMLLACPYVPNPHRAANLARALDETAAFVVESLVPAVRERLPARAGAAHTFLDGCSLGGYVALEVFLRRPEAFGAWGGVQSAVGRASAAAYATRLAKAFERAGSRRLHVETSTGDPFRMGNVALARELAARGLDAELRVAPGPHDQPWLREVGTLEMLLWHDRGR